MAVAKSSRKAHQLVKRRLFAAREYWRNDNARYGRLSAEALLLEHYRQDNALTKFRNRIKPKSLKQFNLLRHKASLLLRSGPDFDTHAVQPGHDAAAAEVSGRIIRNIFLDPLKGYHDARSRMVWDMLSAERGCMAIEWHQRWGVCFSARDPRRIHIAPGQVFMHHPLNPWVMEEIPMRRSELERMKSSGWNIPKDLTYDGGMMEYPEQGGSDGKFEDGITRDQVARFSDDPNDESDPIVTVVKAWFRDDPFGRDNKRFEDSLPEDEWYHVDDTTQEQVRFDPMNPEPPQSTSGNPMRLVTSKAEASNLHEYEDGYLIITAPFYSGESTLYEGGWTDGAINPDAHLSAFPYLELTTYKHPRRRCGISDTELTHSVLIMDNAVTRHGYEQTNATLNLLITQPGALKDSENNQWQFKNVPNDIAYADSILAAEATKWLQAPGINPGVVQMSSLIDQKWQDIGTGDFSSSLGPERSKDIAVGTANLLQQTGDLPTQLHQQDMNLQEAIGGRVALDYSRAYMGDQVVSWVTDEGEVALVTVRGSDLVPLNVSIMASKEWRQQDVDRVQGTAQLLMAIAKAGLPPNVAVALLIDAGVSAKVTSALSDAMQQQQMQQPPQQGLPANAAPGGGVPPQLSVVQGGSPQ